MEASDRGRGERNRLGHLGRPAATVVPLTTGFRVPGAVLALANQLLPSLGVSVPPAVSLRQDGVLEIHHANDLPAATVAAVRAALAVEGSIAVICSDGSAPALATALAEAGQPVTLGGFSSEESTEESRVTVLPATLAKGLEYDHVVVVEPALIDLRELYVALTRPTKSLTVVHSRPLPAELHV